MIQIRKNFQINHKKNIDKKKLGEVKLYNLISSKYLC